MHLIRFFFINYALYVSTERTFGVYQQILGLNKLLTFNIPMFLKSIVIIFNK